jgi:hypothetical protein
MVKAYLSLFCAAANAATNGTVHASALAAGVTSGKTASAAVLATFGTNTGVKIATVLLFVGCSSRLAALFRSCHKTPPKVLVYVYSEIKRVPVRKRTGTLLSFRITLMIALYIAYVNAFLMVNFLSYT